MRSEKGFIDKEGKKIGILYIFERVDKFTTVLRYPNMSNDMIGPLFNYRNEVKSIDLWLKLLPPELLKKWDGKNPDVWKYPSNN